MRRFRSDEFVPNAWRVLVALVSRERASVTELAELTTW